MRRTRKATGTNQTPFLRNSHMNNWGIVSEDAWKVCYIIPFGMSFDAKLVVCLKLPSSSLFLEKATRAFQFLVA